MKNEKQTTKKIKKEDGDYLHQKKIDKDTGKVTKDRLTDPSGNVLSETIEVTQSTAPLVQAKLLSNIDFRLQRLEGNFREMLKIYPLLLEMNYYLAHLEPEDKREDGAVLKHLEKCGIKIQPRKNK